MRNKNRQPMASFKANEYCRNRGEKQCKMDGKDEKVVLCISKKQTLKKKCERYHKQRDKILEIIRIINTISDNKGKINIDKNKLEKKEQYKFMIIRYSDIIQIT
jgi:hypothetical protein